MQAIYVFKIERIKDKNLMLVMSNISRFEFFANLNLTCPPLPEFANESKPESHNIYLYTYSDTRFIDNSFTSQNLCELFETYCAKTYKRY
jgi:hypothetical protein